MFFGEGRLEQMREMIVAHTPDARRKALDQLLPIQRQDFVDIFRVMSGLPVTIRLLDPPLHEFLPTEADQQKALAARLGVPITQLEQALLALHEFNPMLGHRGCRLGITYPEIYEMQVQAIMEAACILAKTEKIIVCPEIEIPLIAHAGELAILRHMIDAVCKAVMTQQGIGVTYKVGTMIELPRAAITAGQLAEYADSFSFGTNDLTQTTMGLSRDDAGKFLPHYLEQKVFPADPFVSIDRDGVGALMQIAVEQGRRIKPDMEIGICGEHGGDPASIAFCEELNLNYVSCSPYRVPVARLAAAHAALAQRP
jgi:pyruvate,orthophosphate dikinase